MSDQKFQGKGAIKFYKHSDLLVLFGLIMLYWSQALYFIAGNKMRLLSLVCGLGLIVAAVFLRARWRIVKYTPFILITGVYFCMLAFLTKFQGHIIWYDSNQLIFCAVCLVLFWMGYILALEKRHDFVSADQWSLVGFAGIAIVCLMAFLRYVKDISFSGSIRGFGESALNPVGVAYANTCLCLIFLVIGCSNRRLFSKTIHLIAASLALGVVLSAASRGAVIWGACSVVYFLLLHRSLRYFSIKNISYVVGACIILIPIITIIYFTNYGIAERIEILFMRFEQMTLSLFGGGKAPFDLSTNARQFYWDHYITTFENWILLGEQGYIGYPHNQWLEILARFGLLGVPLLVLSIFLFVNLGFNTLFKRVRPDLEYSVITVLFVFGYLQSMTSLTLQANRVLWLGFGYVLGVFIVRQTQRMQ